METIDIKFTIQYIALLLKELLKERNKNWKDTKLDLDMYDTNWISPYSCQFKGFINPWNQIFSIYSNPIAIFTNAYKSSIWILLELLLKILVLLRNIEGRQSGF